MTDSIVVAEFPFVVNKSFSGESHPITVPASCKQVFKEYGLIESVRAKICFRNGPVIAGSIRVGMRAGGRYFQITMSRSQESDEINLGIGTRLMVRLLKSQQGWLIEIN